MRALLLIAALACAPAPALAVDPFTSATPGGLLQVHPRPDCVLADINNPAAACKLVEPSRDRPADVHASYLVSRAMLWAYVQKWENAYADGAAAVALRPGDADLMHFAARVALTAYVGHADATWIERARPLIESAVQRRPSDANMIVTLAHLQQWRGSTGEAMASFDRAISLSPDNAIARGGRGQLLLNSNEPERAVFDFDIALKNAPDNSEIRALRLRALIRLSREADALADLDILLKESPNDFQLLFLRVRTNTSLGRIEDGLRDLDYMLGREGDLPRFALGGQLLTSLLMQRAMLRIEAGRMAEAAQDHLQAMETATKPDILRMQVYLRQNGFPSVALDGQRSSGFIEAIKACFGERKCRSGMIARKA